MKTRSLRLVLGRFCMLEEASVVGWCHLQVVGRRGCAASVAAARLQKREAESN